MNIFILIIALLGHILCGITDCLLTYDKGGKRIDFKCISDQAKMRGEFENMPEKFPLLSMILGTFAITAFAFGYFEMIRWTEQFSHACAVIMYIGNIVYLIPIVTHHVFCGIVEWFYVRLERTDEARETVLEFQKKTIITMFAGYAGLAAFAITLFIVIVSGQTPLPQWACVFNTLPMMILLAPTKLPAKGNIAGAAMFLGLIVMSLICG